MQNWNWEKGVRLFIYRNATISTGLHIFLDFHLLYTILVRKAPDCIQLTCTRHYLKFISAETFASVGTGLSRLQQASQKQSGLEPWSCWLAAMNVSNQATLSLCCSWRQILSHTMLCRLLTSPQWHPEEVKLAQNIGQECNNTGHSD